MSEQPPCPPLWTRMFVLLTVANVGMAMIFYMLTATISTWKVTELDASQGEAGLLGTAWFLGAMLARLVGGLVLQRLGERTSVVASLAGLFVGTLLYPLLAQVTQLLALRLVHGFFFGLAATAVAGAALSRIPIERRGEGSGWFSFGLAVSTGLGPFVGSLVQRSSLGQAGVFALGMACSLVSLAGGLLVVRQLHARPAASPGWCSPRWPPAAGC